VTDYIHGSAVIKWIISYVAKDKTVVQPLAWRDPFVLADISPNRGIPCQPHQKNAPKFGCIFFVVADSPFTYGSAPSVAQPFCPCRQSACYMGVIILKNGLNCSSRFGLYIDK
jgi:hypothetical protein